MPEDPTEDETVEPADAEDTEGQVFRELNPTGQDDTEGNRLS